MRDALRQIARRPPRKAAFTLVELLVVIGLMAMLGTISVGGYFAAVRGMTDRGAMQDAMSIVRLAEQTCLIDQTPTAVLFYNRRTQEADTTSGEDTGAEIVGTAVAIKMAGRISFIKNNILVDEFADWNQSYPMSGTANDAGIRFYRMSDLNALESGIDRCSSVVNAYVQPVDLGEEYMIAAGKKLNVWCSDFKKTGSDNSDFSGTTVANGNNQRWGFAFNSGNSGLSSSEWKVGDAYGIEIASLQLPKGYIFGTSAPGSTRIQGVSSLKFRPDDLTAVNSYNFNFSPVTISAYRPKGLVKIGQISSSDLKDD